MEKGQRASYLVVQVRNQVGVGKNNNYHHEITFKNQHGTAYTAIEVTPEPNSKFQVNKTNTFEVSMPGFRDKPDWIRFVSCDGSDVVLNRDNIYIANTAFSAAVSIGVRDGHSEEQIIYNAFLYAAKIKQIAQEL